MSFTNVHSNIKKSFEGPDTLLKQTDKKTSNDSVSTEAYSTIFNPQKFEKKENCLKYCKVELVFKDTSNKIKEVSLYGNFTSGEQTFSLTKNVNKEYKIELNLLEGEYLYKFILDKESKILENQPKNVNSNGIIYNLLLIQSSQNNLKINISLNDFIKEEKNLKNNKSNKKKEIYDCQASQNYFKSKPPKLPDLYSSEYDLSNNEKTFSCENNSYGTFFPGSKISHNFINHLIINSKENKNYLKCSLTKRTKGKLLTVICYSPNN